MAWGGDEVQMSAERLWAIRVRLNEIEEEIESVSGVEARAMADEAEALRREEDEMEASLGPEGTALVGHPTKHSRHAPR